MLGAFVHARLKIQPCIEISRLRPEVDRLLGLPKRLLQYRERSNSIGQIKRSSSVMAAIDYQGLSVARLGQFRTSRILMDVAEMSNRVGQPEGVAHVSADPDRFLVEWQGSIPAAMVAFDLTQPLERTDQSWRITRAPTGGDRLREESVRVVRTPGTTCPVAPGDEDPRPECHRVFPLQLVCPTLRDEPRRACDSRRADGSIAVLGSLSSAIVVYPCLLQCFREGIEVAQRDRQSELCNVTGAPAEEAVASASSI
jgi:hypothetical protein